MERFGRKLKGLLGVLEAPGRVFAERLQSFGNGGGDGAEPMPSPGNSVDGNLQAVRSCPARECGHPVMTGAIGSTGAAAAPDARLREGDSEGGRRPVIRIGQLASARKWRRNPLKRRNSGMEMPVATAPHRAPRLTGRAPARSPSTGRSRSRPCCGSRRRHKSAPPPGCPARRCSGRPPASSFPPGRAAS